VSKGNIVAAGVSNQTEITQELQDQFKRGFSVRSADCTLIIAAMLGKKLNVFNNVSILERVNDFIQQLS
jgi:hypothetical protein